MLICSCMKLRYGRILLTNISGNPTSNFVEIFYGFGDDFFFLVSIVGVGSKLGPLGASATSGLLCLPRVISRVENFVE
jgi:hypothetical protein